MEVVEPGFCLDIGSVAATPFDQAEKHFEGFILVTERGEEVSCCGFNGAAEGGCTGLL